MYLRVFALRHLTVPVLRQSRPAVSAHTQYTCMRLRDPAIQALLLPSDLLAFSNSGLYSDIEKGPCTVLKPDSLYLVMTLACVLYLNRYTMRGSM